MTRRVAPGYSSFTQAIVPLKDRRTHSSGICGAVTLTDRRRKTPGTCVCSDCERVLDELGLERGESWLRYQHFTENVSSVMVAVDGEGIRLGEVFGFSLCGLEEHFCRSFGTQPGTLANLAVQVVTLRNGGPSGPTTPQTRYLTVDVPFGLAFLSYLGKLTYVPTPAIDACIALANIALGQDLVLQNELLDDIKKDVYCSEDLLALTAGTSSDREGVTSTPNSN